MAYCQPFSCMPSIVADKSHCGKRMREREGENVFTWIDFGNSLSFIIVLLLCESDMIQMFVFSKKNGKLNGFRKQKPKSYGLQFSSICENARFGVRFFFFSGPAPTSRLEKEMFLLSDASGGSNSRLFVVPPPFAPLMPRTRCDGCGKYGRDRCQCSEVLLHQKLHEF